MIPMPNEKSYRTHANIREYMIQVDPLVTKQR